MKSPIKFSTKYALDNNFWTFSNHADLLAIKEFKTLYNEDESENKEQSSKIMWAIYFIHDVNSKYINMEESKRILRIETDYLEFPGFFDKLKGTKKKLIDSCVLEYRNLQIDSAKRTLADFDVMLDNRRNFINNTMYSDKTFEMLETMMKNTSNLMKQRADLIKAAETEDVYETTKGGDLSLMAQGKFKR